MSIENIKSVLSKPDHNHLHQAVNKRISSLEDAKQKVIYKAEQQIAKIEQARISSLQILDSEIESCRVYITYLSVNHPALQSVEKMLSSRLNIKIDQHLIEEEKNFNFHEISRNQQ
jgi:hypothetical protein